MTLASVCLWPQTHPQPGEQQQVWPLQQPRRQHCLASYHAVANDTLPAPQFPGNHTQASEVQARGPGLGAVLCQPSGRSSRSVCKPGQPGLLRERPHHPARRCVGARATVQNGMARAQSKAGRDSHPNVLQLSEPCLRYYLNDVEATAGLTMDVVEHRGCRVGLWSECGQLCADGCTSPRAQGHYLLLRAPSRGVCCPAAQCSHLPAVGRQEGTRGGYCGPHTSRCVCASWLKKQKKAEESDQPFTWHDM